MAAQRRSGASGLRPPPASFVARPKAPPPTRPYTFINEGTRVVTNHTFHMARYFLLMPGLIVLVVVSTIEYVIVSLQALSKAPPRTLAAQAAPQQDHAGRSRSPSLRGGCVSETCPIPSPLLHPLWLEQRPPTLPCNHNLRALQFNCHTCQLEFVKAEQSLMVMRPEGMTPLNCSESSHSEGSVLHWDFLSKYVHGHAHELAGNDASGHGAQQYQYHFVMRAGEGSRPSGMQGTERSDGTGGSSASSSRAQSVPPAPVAEDRGAAAASGAAASGIPAGHGSQAAGGTFRDLWQYAQYWKEQGAENSAPAARKRRGTVLSTIPGAHQDLLADSDEEQDLLAAARSCENEALRRRLDGAEVPDHEPTLLSSPCTPPWEKDGLDADAVSDLSEFGSDDDALRDEFDWNTGRRREEIFKSKVLRKLFRRQLEKDKARPKDEASLAKDAEEMSATWCKLFCPTGEPCDFHSMWFQAALEDPGPKTPVLVIPEEAADQLADPQPEPEPTYRITMAEDGTYIIPDDSDTDEFLLAACAQAERMALENEGRQQQGAECSAGPGGSSASSGWLLSVPPPLSKSEQSVPLPVAS